MRVLVTGSSGGIGSQAVLFFDRLGFRVIGVDNNMRADFFGASGDTSDFREQVKVACRNFRHYPLDIRDREKVSSLFREHPVDLVVHAAAQPSKELAARRPLDDFDINAVGTLNLLEACRQHSPEAVFIYVSTNKVYGDGPNRLPIVELETRWDFADPQYAHGIPEVFPIDQTMHSLYGASKLAGDLLAQEYGRYYGMKTGVFRGGCFTGPHHRGVELHGFMSYLVATALKEKAYTVFGYKGKQVRDQIHSHDVVSAFWQFAQNPRPGEVYNLGGGKQNAASLTECVELIHRIAGKRPQLHYNEKHRTGDHICYYSNMAKFREHYPDWKLTYSLREITEDMVRSMLN